MQVYQLLLATACLVCAWSAGCVFTRDPRNRANQLAATLLLGAAFWGTCELLSQLAPDAAGAVLRMRMAAPGWVFIGPLVLHLMLVRQPGHHLRRVLPAIYAFSAAFTALTIFTPFVVQGAVPTPWGWGYELGPGFAVAFGTNLAAVLAGLVLLTRALRDASSPGEKRQRPWTLLSAAVPLCAATVTDALLPLMGIHFPRLGAISFAVLGGIGAWLVFRYGYSLLTPGSFADSILATLPDGVALLKRDERIRRANEGLARLSGYSCEQLAGMHLGNLVQHSFGDLPTTTEDVDCELRRSDGDSIPVSVSTTLLRDRQDYPIGLVVVVRDLREVSDLRRRLVMSARLAAVGELAAGIAHEINNPLAFVRANLSQLESHWKTLRTELGDHLRSQGLRELAAEGSELIEESLEGVDRAAEIVRGVKNFSHGGGDKRELSNVNQILEDVLRVARSQLRRARIERVFSDVPMIPCVPQELKQVFLNLVLNAGHAIEEGGTISLHTERMGPDLVVRVTDDGVGISPKILDRIFDPFFTTKSVGEGTGLGLGIAYQIVRRHRGEISVDSAPGEGTCFRVRLPVGDSDAADA